MPVIQQQIMFQSLIGRLGTAAEEKAAQAAASFQSLIGRLGTKKDYAELDAELAFQSLIGRLGTLEAAAVEIDMASFNPS